MIATFFTHFGATAFARRLEREGKKAEIMPVPRVLSASCGVCARFDEEPSEPYDSFEDLDSVYTEKEGGYEHIFSSDD